MDAFLGELPLSPSDSPGLLHMVEVGLGHLAGLLKVLLEFLAIALIFCALFITIQKYMRHCRRSNFDLAQRLLRLELGRYLGLSLELLLAADIAATAISPSWDAIAKLAAISAIRTFLNYFLEREIKHLEMHESYDNPSLSDMRSKL